MRLTGFRILSTICFVLCGWAMVSAQDTVRELKLSAGGTVEVVNRADRVSAKAVAADEGDEPVTGKMTVTSPKGVADNEIKVTGGGSHFSIEVIPTDPQRRIDITLILPERSKIKAETGAGAVEIGGNFADIDVKTDTGTVAVDVPDDDIKYNFLWTESKPRVLADFELKDIKEKSGGKFEIKGRYRTNNEQRATNSEQNKIKEQSSKIKDHASISLNLTTARGIILLNVPPNEVMSDLRERPLTNAAKAIVRSGDTLLTDAIRRASPKHFGDYARTLPPFEREPRLTVSKPDETTAAPVKTALVRVTDINNRAIAGLGAKDFEVTENGVQREVLSVTHSRAPIDLVLLVDVSGSVENYVNFIRKTARAFVDTVGKSDRVSIVTFNDDVKVLSLFTTDKQKLSESLDTFDAGGGTAYYDALAYVLADTLRPLKGERTAIVILTDGDDNRSFLAFDSLLGSIQESGALIYPLYVPSGLIAAAAANPNADIDPMRRKYMSLSTKSTGEGERLARVSGGVYYGIDQISQIQRAYDDIVLQLRTAYNITFRSEAASVAGTGVSPRLKIKATRENTFTTIASVRPASAAQN
jgi:VWFA-related protein